MSVKFSCIPRLLLGLPHLWCSVDGWYPYDRINQKTTFFPTTQCVNVHGSVTEKEGCTRTVLVLRADPIVLRDWQLDDIDRWRHWMQPGHRWKELDGPYYPGLTSEEIAQRAITLRAAIAAQSWTEPRQRLIIAETATNHLLGLVTWSWESQETWWLSVGIVLYDSASWGHGFGYRALGLWTDYLFRSLPQIVRLDLRTWSGNLGMMQLATKLGFQKEAHFRKARIVRGDYYDGLAYGILREEWTAQHPDGF